MWFRSLVNDDGGRQSGQQHRPSQPRPVCASALRASESRVPSLLLSTGLSSWRRRSPTRKPAHTQQMKKKNARPPGWLGPPIDEQHRRRGALARAQRRRGQPRRTPQHPTQTSPPLVYTAGSTGSLAAAEHRSKGEGGKRLDATLLEQHSVDHVHVLLSSGGPESRMRPTIMGRKVSRIEASSSETWSKAHT